MRNLDLLTIFLHKKFGHIVHQKIFFIIDLRCKKLLLRYNSEIEMLQLLGSFNVFFEVRIILKTPGLVTTLTRTFSMSLKSELQALVTFTLQKTVIST